MCNILRNFLLRQWSTRNNSPDGGPGCDVGESSAAAAARQPGPTMACRVDCSSVDTVETRVHDTERRMMAALEVVNLRVSYQVPIAHKVVASRDVDLYGKTKFKKTKKSPKHDVNKTNESQARSNLLYYKKRKRPRWHSDYVIESNITYCLLTEEREPSTLQKALNNPNASFWKEAMQ
ncbi:hypothetical protein Tco_1327323 [Tanacetum coccineum]